MPVLSVLEEIAATAILNEDERRELRKSADALSVCVAQHFGRKVSTVVRFGSSARDTCLPRKMDDTADVDLLVAFAELSLNPQDYIGRLRNFATEQYPNSIVSRAGPGVALELGNFVFDLVPGTTGPDGKLRIPNPSRDWIYLDHQAFDAEIKSRDEASGGLIKPTIRLMKLWNVANGRPYESFELEQWLCTLRLDPGKNLLGHFATAHGHLTGPYWHPYGTIALSLNRSKKIWNGVVEQMWKKRDADAERELRRLFFSETPEVLDDSLSKDEQYFRTINEYWIPR